MPSGVTGLVFRLSRLSFNTLSVRSPVYIEAVDSCALHVSWSYSAYVKNRAFLAEEEANSSWNVSGVRTWSLASESQISWLFASFRLFYSSVTFPEIEYLSACLWLNFMLSDQFLLSYPILIRNHVTWCNGPNLNAWDDLARHLYRWKFSKSSWSLDLYCNHLPGDGTLKSSQVCRLLWTKCMPSFAWFFNALHASLSVFPGGKPTYL